MNISSGTGTAKNWNAYAAYAGNPIGGVPSEAGDFATNLRGQTARIGLVFSTSNYVVNFYYYISAIVINRTASIKSLMEYLDSKSWTCVATSEAYNMYEELMEMGAYKLLQSQANALNVSHVFANSEQTTYFDLFSYLCDNAGIVLPVTPNNANIIMESMKTNYSTFPFAIVSSSCLIISLVSCLYFKKKQHN